MDHNDQAWAVFRCSLLKPLLLGEIPDSERGAFFRRLSEQTHLLPDGTFRKFSVRTFRRWWRQLRLGGVEALFPQPRADRGQPHLQKTRQQILQRAVQLKREQPRRTGHVINRILRHEFGRSIPHATLYRHLRREGATRMKLGVAGRTVRCRWTRDYSNALWVGDFEHGPTVMVQGVAVKTHLSAWIDCHSRYIVEARYYVRESLDILIDSLLRAWSHHGASSQLYVDNAKIYHAKALQLACAKLHIRLLHRPPRDPAAGGLIERFFQTLQGQLEAEVQAASLLTLDELNQVLQAWLRTDYHQRIHSEIRQTPQTRYEEGMATRRHVDVSSVMGLFHEQQLRKVDRDHSDVQLDYRYFAVDPKLRGDKVLVRYDPFLTGDALQEVELYRTDGVFLGVGKRYQRERGAHSQPTPPDAKGPIDPHYLKALIHDQQAYLDQHRMQGIDFHSAQQRNVWPLASWAGHFARLLGRAGGLSSFTPEELEVLRCFHAQHLGLHEGLLREAFARAEVKTIPQILFHLQNLLS